jgi:hypothetical protein
LTGTVVEYNLTDIKHRMEYGAARKYIQEFMDSPDENKRVNMRAMGISNPVSLYNSCYQAAKRHFPSCRVGREDTVYLVLEKI